MSVDKGLRNPEFFSITIQRHRQRTPTNHIMPPTSHHPSAKRQGALELHTKRIDDHIDAIATTGLPQYFYHHGVIRETVVDPFALVDRRWAIHVEGRDSDSVNINLG